MNTVATSISNSIGFHIAADWNQSRITEEDSSFFFTEEDSNKIINSED